MNVPITDGKMKESPNPILMPDKEKDIIEILPVLFDQKSKNETKYYIVFKKWSISIFSTDSEIEFPLI